ncbi:transcriptional regulator [Polymorphum gilvum]|uniref:Putative transcriptional regulator n=1 Tax=Polymorphum gilvum (strain LMG 25793 / CGMCC 1.9160 / SL003B-26A1) TaxID=991905 RepID=F2J662_POLGS|nr:transcriptional regulator [Polymorphum gilvum]ADZ72426.1 Putative transcriptional regulator [Polymorphum gilvum SL003B-26A1]
MTAPVPMAVKALAAWGAAIPDWVPELAALADREGLNGAARRVGYSPAVVSQVLNARYAGDMARVEERVRGALMGLTVDCPVVGELSRDQCLDWQGKAYAPTSAHRVRMYRACRGGCPHSRVKGGGDAF